MLQPNLCLQVMMLDQSTGSAEVRVKSRLDCETRRNYKLEIVAVACSGQLSNRYEYSPGASGLLRNPLRIAKFAERFATAMRKMCGIDRKPCAEQPLTSDADFLCSGIYWPPKNLQMSRRALSFLWQLSLKNEEVSSALFSNAECIFDNSLLKALYTMKKSMCYYFSRGNCSNYFSFCEGTAIYPKIS